MDRLNNQCCSSMVTIRSWPGNSRKGPICRTTIWQYTYSIFMIIGQGFHSPCNFFFLYQYNVRFSQAFTCVPSFYAQKQRLKNSTAVRRRIHYCYQQSAERKAPAGVSLAGTLAPFLRCGLSFRMNHIRGDLTTMTRKYNLPFLAVNRISET